MATHNKSILCRVEYLLLPGGMQQIIAAYIRDNDIGIHPMKMFLNGAQVVSRGFKEGLRNTFKGFPLVSMFSLQKLATKNPPCRDRIYKLVPLPYPCVYQSISFSIGT